MVSLKSRPPQVPALRVRQTLEDLLNCRCPLCHYLRVLLRTHVLGMAHILLVLLLLRLSPLPCRPAESECIKRAQSPRTQLLGLTVSHSRDAFFLLCTAGSSSRLATPPGSNSWRPGRSRDPAKKQSLQKPATLTAPPSSSFHAEHLRSVATRCSSSVACRNTRLATPAPRPLQGVG